ncbi:hypothetical protein [Nitrospira sp. Nam74]
MSRYVISRPVGLVLVLVLCSLLSAQISEGLDANIPTLVGQANAITRFDPSSVIVMFGPLSLSEHPHALIPKHVFTVPRDMFVTGYKATFSTSRGDPLPRKFIHHILLSKVTEANPACPGTLNFFGGLGFELTEATLPSGYGVKLTKGERVMALVALHEDLPDVDDAIVTLTMQIAAEGSDLEPLQSYHIGVNIGCKTHDMAQDETEHGIKLPQGILVRTVPLKFMIDGCVKYAYPHAHDQLLLMTLENKTKQQTLLRTVPHVSSDGTLQFFPSDQVYSSPTGFSVNTADDYEVGMVYHLPLEDQTTRYGMANYNLYLTPGQCSKGSATVVTSK